MSKALSKSKEKPPRSTSNETNTSFVKNVTSRVSGLLPSTITKWFSSTSSSNANGSVSTAEATDSSTEDEAPESPISSPPPVKRMRFNKPTKLNHVGASDAHCSTGNIEITEIPATSFAGMQYPSSHSNVTLTSIKINDTVTNESLKDSNEMETPRFDTTKHTVSRIGQSVITKRRSIFERTSDKKPVKVMSKAPPNPEKNLQFKPHMLGSTFYPGRTMYGGASAAYMRQANIRQHTVAFVNETKSNEDTIMSSSARRIMDLLESYSSPLMEARRIPQYIKPNIPMNRSTHQSALNPNKNVSYKTQELHMPSLALRMRLKQKSRLMDATKKARQIIASCSSASNYPPAVIEPLNETYNINAAVTESLNETYNIIDASEDTNGNRPSNDSNTIKESNTVNASNTSQPKLPRNESEEQQSNKFTTKLKTRVTRTSHGISDKADVATPVNLPAVSLQIDHNKLPKFTLVAPTITKSLVNSTPRIDASVPKRAESKPANELPASKPTSASSSSMFTFSNPVKVSCDTIDSTVSFPSFTFDDPERHFEYDKQSPISSVVVSNEESNKSIPKISDWNCPDCWVKNKAEVKACVCCGYKKVNPAKCSLCKLADSQAQKDKCINCEKMVNPPSKKSSKWRCDDCWVMNDANASKCVCCNGRNLTPDEKAARKAEMPPKVKPIPYPKNAGLFFGSSSASQAEEANSNVVSSQPSLLKSNDVGDSTLANIAKTQKSNKWECYSCLVMNESNRSLCVCCGTDKESKAKLPEVKFNFGMNTNNTFKFGIDPTVKEDKAPKKPEIKSTSDVKEKSETNNNNLAETPNYTFTLPAKKSEKQIDLSEPKSVSVVKFNFGIPNDSNALENKSQHSKTLTKEKAQGTPAIVNPLKVQEAPKPLSECFASSQQKDKEKLSNSTSNLFTPKPLELKKDIPKIPTIQPIPTSTEKPESNSTFVLGSSTLKPGTNLFSMPSASGISKDPFSSIPKTTTVTTTATTMLLMPAAQSKTEALSAVTSSVNKSVIAASMFSFGEKAVTIPAPTTGSTLSTAVTSTDKPNFQFSFGNNNSIKADATPSLLTSSDEQSVFNSPFGKSGETPKNTNNFSFNAGGTLGTSRPIGTLGGVNGLSASNALSGRDRANNMLGGNNLTGSALTGNGLPTNILTGKALSGNTFSTTNTTGGNNVTATSTLGGINGRPGNTLTGGNGMQHDNTLSSNALTNNTTNIFGSTVQKENMWNSSNNAPPSTNLFVTNTTTNNLQKPPAFSFASSTAFNSSSATPNFAGNPQPGQNIFGMANQNNNQPSLFSSSIRNPSPAPIFGSPQPANNATPQMFGASTIGTTPTFGTTNPSLPSFEAPSMPSKSAPAFNFGTPVQSSGVFGFGQQQANQQPQQAGVYSFGGAPSGTPQVQFTMGTAPNTAGRRLRKAVRRTTPR